ncbi:MAG: hypothetical protein HYY96_11125 [Candidatus Tectomicrobia bacterium]|nr:hypothetical protein [Candidatus Tectomicrobia bacterium]
MTETSPAATTKKPGHPRKEIRVEPGAEGYILSFWDEGAGRWMWRTVSSLDAVVDQLKAYLGN